MLFIDDVCQIVFMDGAAFEAKHPRDSGGKFSTFGAGTRKSKSQLKREHKAKTLEQFYGEEIKGKNLKGRRALFKMLEERKGFIRGAFHRDDIGDIDLVWGDSEARLEHIIQRRMDKGQNLKRVLMNLSTAIQNGRLERAGERNGSVAIRYGKQRVCLSTRKKGRDISFVITAYELDAK